MSPMHPALQRLANVRLLRPAYRTLRRKRILWSVAVYKSRTVEHVYAGVPLRVALRDALAAGWYDHDWGRQPELDLLTTKGRLNPGALVFDLGAHQGVVALMCAARVGDGRVVAVEAEPHNVVVARENASLNPSLPVIIEHAAAAAECGTLWFTESLNGAVRSGGRAGKIAVPAITIDDLATRHGNPDVVLVDVEGFEGRVIEGAGTVLQNGRTDFFVEIHDADTIGEHGWNGRGLAEHLLDYGADVWIAAAYDGPPKEFCRLADADVDWDKRLFCIGLFPGA